MGSYNTDQLNYKSLATSRSNDLGVNGLEGRPSRHANQIRGNDHSLAYHSQKSYVIYNHFEAFSSPIHLRVDRNSSLSNKNSYAYHSASQLRKFYVRFPFSSLKNTTSNRFDRILFTSLRFLLKHQSSHKIFTPTFIQVPLCKSRRFARLARSPLFLYRNLSRN